MACLIGAPLHSPQVDHGAIHAFLQVLDTERTLVNLCLVPSNASSQFGGGVIGFQLLACCGWGQECKSDS